MEPISNSTAGTFDAMTCSPLTTFVPLTSRSQVRTLSAWHTPRRGVQARNPTFRAYGPAKNLTTGFCWEQQAAKTHQVAASTGKKPYLLPWSRQSSSIVRGDVLYKGRALPVYTPDVLTRLL